MVITEGQMESRKRILTLNSAVTNSMADIEGITYTEALSALLEMQSRLVASMRAEEWEEGVNDERRGENQGRCKPA